MNGSLQKNIIRIKSTFRGQAVKNQINVQEVQPKKMLDLNKIIVKYSVLFKIEVQKHRNEVIHDPEKIKSSMVKWHENMKNMIINEDRPEMKYHMRMQEINAE